MPEFEKMKLRSAYSYMIFKISDDKKSIELECTGEPGASFQEFKDKLPDGDCRYAVYDVTIATKSGAEANKLIFVAWSDDNASVRPKMLYASSKDALKKALQGINEEYQVCATPGRGRRAARCAYKEGGGGGRGLCTRERPARRMPHYLTPPRVPPLACAVGRQATDRGDLDLAEIKKKAGSV